MNNARFQTVHQTVHVKGKPYRITDVTVGFDIRGRMSRTFTLRDDTGNLFRAHGKAIAWNSRLTPVTTEES